MITKNGLIANTYFTRMESKRSNATLLGNYVKNRYLRLSVVKVLSDFETRDPGTNWWEEKDLLEIFKRMSETGALSLPKDSVERLRWVALVCISCCEKTDFDCGNLIVHLDYIPDDLLDESYGSDVLSQIRFIRQKLTVKGWVEVFGW